MNPRMIVITLLQYYTRNYVVELITAFLSYLKQAPTFFGATSMVENSAEFMIQAVH